MREEGRSRGPSQRVASLIPPTPTDPQLIEFIADLFESGFPQRLVLCVATGAGGRRLGASLKEVVYKPNAAKPTQEELVVLANSLYKIAREECDALGKKSLFAVLAYDPSRGAQFYARKLLSIYPPGESQAFAEARGEADDEEETSQKLVLGLLEEQRRHTRWMLEQNNTMHGAIMEQLDNQNERTNQMFGMMGKMMDQFGTMFGKMTESHVKNMVATEQAISQADERAEKREDKQFKREKIEQGLQLVGLAIPQVAEAIKAHQQQKQLAKNATSGGSSETEKKPPNNPVDAFLQATTVDQDKTLFGIIEDNGKVSAPGIFTEAQMHGFLRISQMTTVDKKQVQDLVDSISQDQMQAVQTAIPMGMLIPLVTWFNQMKD